MGTTRDLSFLRNGSPARRVMIVSPHPDDEVIGAGTRLPLLPELTVVEVTDGAPQEDSDARAAGCSTREEYAALRASELKQALERCGVHEIIHLNFPDQRASYHITQIAERLAAIFDERRPEAVVTVPYEGGHPDHDATALAVRLASGRVALRERPLLVETLSYHACEGRCEMESFLDEDAEILAIQLSAEERNFKRELFHCFASQKRVLCWFPLNVEKFRLAPVCDFTLPPHEGTLYYEKFPWGMDGARWRDLAREAMAAGQVKNPSVQQDFARA